MPARPGAVLLRSQEVQKLFSEAIVVDHNKPASDYYIPYGQFAYVFVYNNKGEFQGAFRLDQVRPFSAKNYVARIKQLQKQKSLNHYENAYLKSGSEKDKKAMLDKYKEIESQYWRAATIFDQVAENKKFSKQVRLDARINAFEAASIATSTQVINLADDEKATARGVELMPEITDPEVAVNVAKLLFDKCLRYKFDVPAKCKEMVTLWKSKAPDSKAVEAASDLLDKFIEELRTKKTKHVWEESQKAGRLGKAEETLKYIKDKKVSWLVMRQWTKDAEAKLKNK